jgi:hypothetical protein
MKKKPKKPSRLSLNPFSYIASMAHTNSMHPLSRLENESESGAISAYWFIPHP